MEDLVPLIEIILSALVGFVLGRVLRTLTPSFLKLKDRSLPFAWPWVECTGMTFFAITAWTHGLQPSSLPGFLFALFLLAIMACDYGWKLIPDSLSHGGILVGLICAMVFPMELIGFLSHADFLRWVFPVHVPRLVQGLFLSTTGAITGFLVLEAIRRVFFHMTKMEVMGLGDAKLMALIGAFLGPEMTLMCLLLASIFGIINGLGYRLVFNVPHSPFGPALALGALAMFHFHQSVVGGLNSFYAIFYSLPSTAILVVFATSLLVLIWLVWRIKRRAALYSEEIEKDYQEIEQELESPLE